MDEMSCGICRQPVGIGQYIVPVCQAMPKMFGSGVTYVPSAETGLVVHLNCLQHVVPPLPVKVVSPDA